MGIVTADTSTTHLPYPGTTRDSPCLGQSRRVLKRSADVLLMFVPEGGLIESLMNSTVVYFIAPC